MFVSATSLDAVGSVRSPDLRTGRYLDVNRALARLGPALDLLAAEGIEVEFDLSASHPLIEFETETFARVSTDLLDQMRNNMPGGGSFRIRTRDGSHEFIEIELHDTGTESSREELESMFGQDARSGAEPMHHGLSEAFRLVHDAGGTIVCETGPGWGTCLRVLLPALNDSSPLLQSVAS